MQSWNAAFFLFFVGYSLGGEGGGISGRVRALNLTVPLGSGRVGSDNLGYGPGSGFSFEPVQTSSMVPFTGKHINHLDLLHKSLCDYYTSLRWPRELNALQLQKTHANRKMHEQIKKTFSSVWQQIVKMLTTQTNKLYLQRVYFFSCVVSICSACVVKLRKLFS